MHNIARVDSWNETLRPFAWLGVLSFVAGFWGYMAFAPLIAR